jgi:hypothetical protein
MTRATVILAVLTAVMAHAAPVQAEQPASTETPGPAADGRETEAVVTEAREAFRIGTALAREERWDEARVAFVRSNASRPHPVTLYNIAYCDRAMGRPARALASFQQALADHAAGTRGKLPDALVSAARQYLAEARARVGRVSLVELAGAEIQVDGHSLEALHAGVDRSFVIGEGTEGTRLALGSSPVVLVDPGTHVFVARRTGRPDVVQSRTLAAGEEVRISFEATPPPLPADASVAGKAALAPRRPRATTPRPWRPDRRFSYVAFGVSGAGLVLGSVAGVIALNTRSRLESACDATRECPQRSRSDVSQLRTSATISTVGFVVGAAALGTGVVLWALSAKAHATEHRISLGITPNALFVRGTL